MDFVLIFFISLVLRRVTWKDMCVCRCTAFKYQTVSVLGGCSTLCWGEHLGWFEASCSLGENAPVVSSFLDLSMELHPPPHLPQSTFASLVVAAHFYQGLGFALIGAAVHLQVFSLIPWLEWLAPCCIPSFLPAVTPALFAFYFSLSAVQCMPGSPHYKFVLWFFSSSCGRWQLMSTDLQNPFSWACVGSSGQSSNTG